MSFRNQNIILLFFLLLSTQVFGQKEKPVSPDLQFYDVVKKDFIKLETFKDKTAIVFIFTSLFCPYVDIYEDRIIALSKEYGSQNVHFAFVNSNNVKVGNVESIPDMFNYSKKTGITYYSDQMQVVKNIFQVRKNPEVVILSLDKGEFVKSYQGAIDDNPQSPDEVEKDYIRLALNNLIKKKPSPVYKSQPVGCSIRSSQ